MNIPATTPHRLSGGETPPSPEIERLKELIRSEEDVFMLHALSDLPGGRFAYMIQTPFATFPKFAVGTTDKDNASPAVLLQCATKWSAEDYYNKLINP